MSAALTAKAPIRVLVAEESEETASRIDSVLRDAGHATRIQTTADPDEIGRCLADNDCDIAFLPTAAEHFQTLIEQARAANRNIPLIAYSQGPPPETTGTIMAFGASDLVCLGDTEHVTHVAAREIEYICQRVRAAQLARQLKEVDQRCMLLLQGSRAPIAYLHEGMHVYANPAYLQFFGCEDVDDMLGVSIMDFLQGDCTGDFKELMKALRTSDEEMRFPFSATSLNDTSLDGIMVLANSMYEGEHCLQATILPAQSAPLHSAPTPVQSNLDLGSFLKVCDDTRSEVTQDTAFMFVAGLDGLDAVRSEFGLLRAEKFGDRVFMLLEEHAGNRPLLRLSPHEFAIGFFGAEHEAATNWAQEVQRLVRDADFDLDAGKHPIALSIVGVPIAADVEHALDAGYQTLLDLDTAAKPGQLMVEGGIAAIEETPELDEAGRMLARITEAIENQSFRLLYQPIISLRGDDDEHYEVFLRMIDSEGNDYVPDQFLRTAIEHGVAAKMDRWVILQSIKALCIHRGKGHNTRLTINVTSNSVADREFIKWLTVAIKAARLPSDAVIFQITEQDAWNYREQTADFVNGLRRMHCQTAIGRFGLKDDPFDLLGDISVDMVKVDGSLIRTLQTDSDAISPLLKELQKLGKFTVVPMVESAAQLTALWQAGANYIQGHYLQEPRPEMDYDFSVEEDD
ncbi:MAG: EAL domain-containing protein [Pseudomonadales bacterium]|nr:EAL domain-containing protein [Pseudomonadales bacterium]MCP5183317.1 EAL domain-containing protein [Pseudomonadales bacterium]